MYVIGFLAGGVAVLVGVVIAYLARQRTSDRLLVSHYSWQIRIFWWSLVAFIVTVIAAILFFSFLFWALGVLFGGISLLVITITVVVLAIRGMLNLSSDRLAR